MRRHLSRLAAVAVSITLTVGVCSTAAATAAPASAVSGHPLGQTTRTTPVFLINGERPGAASPGGQTQILTLDGHAYALPSEAMPYLGHGLDPSLFNLAAVSQTETGGRLPVRVRYTGQVPELPGVTITSAGHGSAAGYLTSAGAARFGAALTYQFTADRTSAGYGRDGLFAHNVAVTLAGAPAASAASAASVTARKYTLTVHGTNLSGQPDTGDYVVVTNVDDSTLSTPANAVAEFHGGVAKLSLPAGNYWAVGEFGLQPGISPVPVSRVVALPQFGVTANTTVRVAERAATSQIRFVTQRPAVTRGIDFGLYRTPATGLVTGLQWFNSPDEPGKPAPPLYVSPTQVSPATGALTSVSEGWLYSRPDAPGTPYEYDLVYPSAGTVPAQRYLVKQASLATVNDRYYGAATADGLEVATHMCPSNSGPASAATPARVSRGSTGSPSFRPL